MFFLFFNSQNANAADASECLSPLKYIAHPALGFNELMMKWSKPDDHPYGEACEPIDLKKGQYFTAKSNKEKNNLNIFINQLPDASQGGMKLAPFFLQLREKIKTKIAAEKRKIKGVKDCLKLKSSNECIKISDETRENLGVDGEYNFNDLVSDARFNLVLSVLPSNFLGKNRSEPQLLNFNMKTYGIYKEKKWTQSLGQETADARQVLNGYFDEAKKKLGVTYNPKNIKHKVLVGSNVSTVRHKHFTAYTALIASYSILQFIENENPDKKEVSEAVDGMLASLEKEEKWLAKTTQSLDSGASLDTDLLKIMNYRTEVSDTLSKESEYCGIARDLKHVADAKGLGFDVAVSLPVMVGSFFVPVSYAALGGIMTGGILSSNEQGHVRQSSFQVLGRFDASSEEELNKLSEDVQSRNLELFFTALSVPGLKISSLASKNVARKVSDRIQLSRKSHTISRPIAQ